MGNPEIPPQPNFEAPPHGDAYYYSVRYVLGQVSAPAERQLPKAGPEHTKPVEVTIDHPHGGRIMLTYRCLSYKHHRNRFYFWQLQTVDRVE